MLSQLLVIAREINTHIDKMEGDELLLNFLRILDASASLGKANLRITEETVQYYDRQRAENIALVSFKEKQIASTLKRASSSDEDTKKDAQLRHDFFGKLHDFREGDRGNEINHELSEMLRLEKISAWNKALIEKDGGRTEACIAKLSNQEFERIYGLLPEAFKDYKRVYPRGLTGIVSIRSDLVPACMRLLRFNTGEIDTKERMSKFGLRTRTLRIKDLLLGFDRDYVMALWTPEVHRGIKTEDETGSSEGSDEVSQ